jgi:hypothetical protein
MDFNVAAFHDSPVRAREKIREAAARCLRKIDTVERFWMEPPYVYERIGRPDENGIVKQAVNRSDDFLDLLSQPAHFEPLDS